MTRVTLNGRSFAVPDGATLLEACRRAEIEVPTLCHDDRLKPAGACRLCLVQVRGWHHLVPACATPVADGMEIETHTPEIEETRRTLLQMLADEYPADVVERWPEKPFHLWLRHYGLSPKSDGRNPKEDRSPRFEVARDAMPEVRTSELGIPPDFGIRFSDFSHPYLAADMSRCIDCFRCVRICNQVQGQFVWHVAGPGHDAHIVP